MVAVISSVIPGSAVVSVHRLRGVGVLHLSCREFSVLLKGNAAQGEVGRESLIFIIRFFFFSFFFN